MFSRSNFRTPIGMQEFWHVVHTSRSLAPLPLPLCRPSILTNQSVPALRTCRLRRSGPPPGLVPFSCWALSIFFCPLTSAFTIKSSCSFSTSAPLRLPWPRPSGSLPSIKGTFMYIYRYIYRRRFNLRRSDLFSGNGEWKNIKDATPRIKWKFSDHICCVQKVKSVLISSQVFSLI